MSEWLNQDQPIRAITFHDIDGHCAISLGQDGITKIEAITKSGMHSDIAYVRAWKDDVISSEFCQHNLTGVFF